MTKLNFISIIIPVYSDPEGLKETLISLEPQLTSGIDCEIIVVNDGGDIEIQKVCQLYLNIKLIDIKPRRGSYYARNRGIEIATGEYLAFVDAGVVVSDKWLRSGIVELQSADYVAGNVIVDEAVVRTIAHHYELCTAFPLSHYFSREHFGVTANLFVRAEVFRVLGLFDERLKSGGDFEFGNRVYNSKKFRQKYSQETFVLHPPRSYRQVIKKLKRTIEGRRSLFRLYPQRFYFIQPSIKLILRSLLPCHPQVITKCCERKGSVLWLKLFLYCWWIKLLTGIYQIVIWRSFLFVPNSSQVE